MGTPSYASACDEARRKRPEGTVVGGIPPEAEPGDQRAPRTPATCRVCGLAENPRACIVLHTCTECGEEVCSECSDGDIGWEGVGWVVTCHPCIDAAEQHDADERDGLDAARGTL